MDKITIRKGKPEDARAFLELALYTAPEYFGEIFGLHAGYILERLFEHPRNIFSFKHSYFMDLDGEIAGMTLFYEFEKKNSEVIPFLLLLIKHQKFDFLAHLPALLKFGSIFAQIKKGDLYSSNTALYPKFRGRGLGNMLFSLSEEEARAKGLKRIVVDVKADNQKAIELRKKLGYKIEARLPVVRIKNKTFEYLRLVKYL